MRGEPTLVDGASFDGGAEVTFDLAFTPAPGRAYLAVSVSGVFGGGHRGRVRSFAVGAPTVEQQPKATGLTVESDDGDRVKVVIPGQ